MSRHAATYDVRTTRHHRLMWLIMSMVLIALVSLAFLGFRFYVQVKQVTVHEQKAMSLVGSLAADGVQSSNRVSRQLPEIQHETGAARTIANGALWKMMAHIPVVGNDVVTIQGMTTTADDIVTQAVPKFAHAVTELKSSKLSVDGGLNLQPLLDAQKGVTEANTALQRSVRQFNALPQPRIGEVNAAYTNAKNQLDSVAHTVASLSNTLDVLPDFLGADQTKTYAVMAMTTSEARSAGGLIGSVGVMTTSNGKISINDFKTNTEYLPYGIGNPTADESRIFNQWGPLQMSFDIRDMAVYPDTSRTAEGMRAIWQRTPWGNHVQLDGVLMVDPVFLQKLIAINGDVALSNGQVLTGSNTAEFLLNTVYKDYSPLEQDLYFQQVATQSIANMFRNVNLTKLTAIGQAMGTMTKQRHLSMYAFDTQAEHNLSAAGFTAQTPRDEEHPAIGVYVTEQNPSKMDWYIHRTSTITRSSCNTDGSQTYHVQYTLANTLSKSVGASLPAYIKGVNQANMPQMYGIEKVLIYGPAGGSVVNLTSTGDVSDMRNETMNGQPLHASIAKLAPGASVTYAFDVRTSKRSVSDLSVDQTPMGWEGNGVKDNFAACSIGRGE